MAREDVPFGPSADWQRLEVRAALLERVRRFFGERDFLEVETPILSADTVVDRHLDPIPVTLFDDPRDLNTGRRMWLQTSPELCMKRLLAAGSPPAIYQITRAFRGGECGRRHNPEFTIVEWYRVGDDYQAGIELLSQFAQAVYGSGLVRKTTYRDAFQQRLAIDPLSAKIDTLKSAALSSGAPPPPDFPDNDRDSWLEYLLTEFIEPKLGRDSPEILFDYPASQAALARVTSGDPPVAERFELYVHGIELANGYHELLDAAVLRERISSANAQRAADGKYILPTHHRLLDAMDHGLPSCTGVALGFDRLVMVACGATSLSDVMAFPIDRA